MINLKTKRIKKVFLQDMLGGKLSRKGRGAKYKHPFRLNNLKSRTRITEREREREKESDREKERERDRKSERERDRERKINKWLKKCAAFLFQVCLSSFINYREMLKMTFTQLLYSIVYMLRERKRKGKYSVQKVHFFISMKSFHFNNYIKIFFLKHLILSSNFLCQRHKKY